MKALILENKNCKQCGKSFGRDTCKRVSDYKEKKFCNRECFHAFHKGENHGRFVRGYRIRPDGYQRNTVDKYIHRLVVEDHIGRPLRSDEHVHHENEDPSDNRLQNLKILSNSEHRKLHNLRAKRNERGQYAR